MHQCTTSYQKDHTDYPTKSAKLEENDKKDKLSMLVSQHRKTLSFEELSESLRCSSTGNRTLVSRGLSMSHDKRKS
jgi:hypothetical protein